MQPRIIGLTLVTAIAALGVMTVMSLPREAERPDPGAYIERGVEQTGALNQVSSILFDYRGFDTLGEATVILATALVVGLVAPRTRTSVLSASLSVIVRDTVALLLPFLLVFGFYIILFGHISPGGGFTGGVMLAAAVIVYSLAYCVGDRRRFLLSESQQKMVENGGMLMFLGIGLVGIGTGGAFLTNAATGVSLGHPGSLASAGLIPFLNLASGLKVGAGLSIVFFSLIRE
ncbi:MAG: sodium:proton antiporter [Spirochaetaceae bacterium]|nr:MAG: sodium:proton antiporter [Spirochaetaceae bacterium]